MKDITVFLNEAAEKECVAISVTTAADHYHSKDSTSQRVVSYDTYREMQDKGRTKGDMTIKHIEKLSPVCKSKEAAMEYLDIPEKKAKKGKINKGDADYIINESERNSSNLEDLKKQLLKMDAGDRIHAVWGVREKWTDATRKDRMVDYAISIDKEKGDKYVICGVIDFRAHDLFWDALKAAGVEKWYHFKGFAVKLGYEDMCKVLDVMPKFFDKKEYVNGPRGIWHFLSFDKKECEEECKRQIRPLTITSLEDEIKGIEQGIKDLEAKKAELQELKKAQAEDDMWKWANSEK